MTKWQKKLTKAQRKHAREWCGGTLAGVKRAVALNRKLRAEWKHGPFPGCWECLEIGDRLGI